MVGITVFIKQCVLKPTFLVVILIISVFVGAIGAHSAVASPVKGAADIALDAADGGMDAAGVAVDVASNTIEAVGAAVDVTSTAVDTAGYCCEVCSCCTDCLEVTGTCCEVCTCCLGFVSCTII